MTPGYFHANYYVLDYWHEDYWQDYGLVVPPTAPVSPSMDPIEIIVDSLAVTVEKTPVGTQYIIIDPVETIYQY